MKNITPTVNVDGESVSIEGWMFVLSFALAGIEWAVKEACDPKFNMREKIIDYEKRKNNYHLTLKMKRLEKELAEIKTKLGI